MAFDGITIAGVTRELNEKLTGGRINKVAQPEKDELLLTVKTGREQVRLLISADPSLPLIYLTEANKTSPATAPAFCMLLRKYLQNAKITGFYQPDFERIIRMELLHMDEMGDEKKLTMVIELMGRYSNIILIDDENKIIDSIKRIPIAVSSVREVLPGREYYLPKVLEKKNPVKETKDEFLRLTKEKDGSLPVFKGIYTEYTGIAPFIAKSICAHAGIEKSETVDSIDNNKFDTLWDSFRKYMDIIEKGDFTPYIFYKDGMVLDYAPIDLPEYPDKKGFDSMSSLLESFYSEKNVVSRIRQRSFDIRRIVQNAIDRTKKKIELQEKQFEDTADRDKYRIYGELLNTYGYGAKQGDKSIEVLNYYDNEMINIPLDPLYSPKDNAKRYFTKYNKLKRTFEALTGLMEENKKELMHLESIMTSLDLARNEEDLVQIKEELIDSGYVRRRRNLKAPKITSKPYHYISSDGFDIYVGKNNYQNDKLTFKIAGNKDLWFHAKNMPGSHVIVMTGGADNIPDRVYEEAAALAARYSQAGAAGENPKVEIDYTERKNIKKPVGAAPGYVIYHTNYSMIGDGDISKLKLVSD